MFGIGNSPALKNIIDEGAIILDVRSKGVYAQGHVKGSINIPVDALQNNLKKLDKNKPVVTCCASGMRSASAKSILKAKGYARVYDGGSWGRLQSRI